MRRLFVIVFIGLTALFVTSAFVACGDSSGAGAGGGVSFYGAGS